MALCLLLLLAILIPFSLYESQITGLTRRVLGAGYPRWVVAAALGGLLAVDIVLPVPSTLVSTAAGGLLGLWGGALVSWAGMSAGCLVGYFLGRGAGQRAARRLVGPQELERVSRATARWGDGVIIVLRAAPVLAEASVFFAGLTRMPLSRFLLLALSSNLGISLVYAAIGAFSVRVESFLLAFAGAILVPLVMLLIVKRRYGA